MTSGDIALLLVEGLVVLPLGVFLVWVFCTFVKVIMDN